MAISQNAEEETVSLTFVDDQGPGITRYQRGRHFIYRCADGKKITDVAEVARLDAVAMPPAYKRCWFCPDPAGHIQATGYDARGRKQYRYHTQFRDQQEKDKFAQCADFGESLPKIRKRVERALRQPTPSRERTLAALVRLLDVGLIRVGNDRYVKENGSFGASTLRMRHAKIEGGKVRLSYRGKSGQMRDITLQDKHLLRFVRQMQDLPGQRLFQYIDESGIRHEVGSSEVNAYIRETMGDAFSAKHFRTWGGTLVAFSALLHSEGPLSLRDALQKVASALGNTPAISRKSYIHPRVMAAIIQTKGAELHPMKLPRATTWLSREERALIAFLRRETR